MIYVNGIKISEEFSTVAAVCLALSDDPESVATALNGEFIPKSLRASTLLNAGDELEIVAPLEGG
jgi:sulfur carrier protein